MATEGIEAVFLETRNWGKAARFFQDLGFTLEFDTGHSSGQLRNGDGPAAPPVLEDRVGLQIAAPEDGWRERPDMDPHLTARFRASIVARARFIEDLVAAAAGRESRRGVTQYVILGAGNARYLAGRADGLRSSTGEDLLIATI